MMPFKQFAQIYNKYCICYFGHVDAYLIALAEIRPLLEEHFTGMNIYLGCRDEKAHLWSDEPKIVKASEFKVRRSEFAYVKELRYGGTNLIEDFVKEAGIDTGACSYKSLFFNLGMLDR